MVRPKTVSFCQEIRTSNYLCAMMSYCYPYPRPAVTVDCAVFFRDETGLELLLIQRKNSPFEGLWSFPGGFVDINEDLEAAALRELEEETALTGIKLEQFKAYGNPNRDPRHRTITIVFVALLNHKSIPKAGDDAAYAQWFNIKKLPDLAFDHLTIFMDIIENRRDFLQFKKQ